MSNSIVFFHSSIWADFFSDLLLKYQTDRQSDVAIVCNESDKYLYERNFNNGAKHYCIPDLEQIGLAIHDENRDSKVAKLIRACENAATKSVSRISLCGERNIGAGFSSGFYYWPQGRLRNHHTLQKRAKNKKK